MDFYSFISQLQAIGFFEYVLPFLLVFAITFSILEKTKIFGTVNNQPRTNVNVLVALIIAALLIAQTEIVMVINTFIPKMALFILVVLMFLIAFGMLTGKTEEWGGIMGVIALIVCFLAVIWALTPTAGIYWPYWLRPTYQDRAWIFLLATIVLVIWLIARKPKEQSPTRDIMETLFGKK